MSHHTPAVILAATRHRQHTIIELEEEIQKKSDWIDEKQEKVNELQARIDDHTDEIYGLQMVKQELQQAQEASDEYKPLAK